ncbi:MAG: PIN domain-containing protein [Treponema sp.]|nr:PIN domain-containing protein [Treponema sp.]
MKVLVDTNVILDVLLKREPFYEDAFVLFQLADRSHVEGILAAVSMTNIFYLLRKAKNDTDDVYQIMEKLKSLFSVASVSDTTISKALALRWKDFEDAVQFITAKESNVDYIITRNEADYRASDIPCMSATDFIAYLKGKEEAEQ